MSNCRQPEIQYRQALRRFLQFCCKNVQVPMSGWLMCIMDENKKKFNKKPPADTGGWVAVRQKMSSLFTS